MFATVIGTLVVVVSTGGAVGQTCLVPGVRTANALISDRQRVDAQRLVAPLQVEAYDTIAAGQCRFERVAVDTRMAYLLVPRQGVCSGVRRISRIADLDGVIQVGEDRLMDDDRHRNDTVATRRCREHVRVDRTLSEDAVRPSVTCTCLSLVLGVLRLDDRQLHGDRTVAALR